MIFKVYFEMYGKKLMKRVNAENVAEAKAKVFRDIIFYKIQQEDNIVNTIFKMFSK
jgi:hypothetical protein